jgi:2-polyprenyl-3-methyl-5-hydroxy-6-metoxy-1,4-benzoquinol methylase
MDHRHRTLGQPIKEVQSENAAWWTNNPMTYDWHETLDRVPLTEPWFDEVDRRWIEASYPYLSANEPFDKIMPANLEGQSVLEIGCGIGLHTQLLAQHGADVTAIDLTEPAVHATTTRMQLRGLAATVQRGDAEALSFKDDTFDLVWSWGVIHHSSKTARIVREISRVLKPHGQTRIMVYNRDALLARLVLLRYYVLGQGYRTKSTDEVLWAHTDGFLARHYTIDGLDDLLRGFFRDSTTQVLGQEPDVVPLPARFRKLVIPRISDQRKEMLAARRGGFLFTIAEGPL